MRKLILLAFALLFLPVAEAQGNGPIPGFCVMGGVSALVQGLKSTNLLMGIVPSCTVTVYLTGTSTPATLYSDAAGDPLANPFTSTNLASAAPGQWIFYASLGQVYDVVLTGGIAPNTYSHPVTLVGLGSGGGSGGGASSAPPYSVQYASPTTGAFASDPSIIIDPINHIFQAPEVLVPGAGTGSYGIGDASTGNIVWQTAQAGTTGWTWYWPIGPPTSGNQCMTSSTGGAGSFQGCLLLTGGTLTGPLVGTTATFASVNTVVNAGQFPGADIGAKANAALASANCLFACEVDIPAGTYTGVTTSISLPLNFLSHYRLNLLAGATILYAGSGCAITTTVVGSPTESNLEISGGQIYGTAAGKGGICVLPTNSFHIHDMVIDSFSNGYGIWLQGANAGTIDNNFASGNSAGVYATPTYCSGTNCGTGVVGTGWTVNAINIHDNQLVANGWGAEYFDLVSANLPSSPLLLNIHDNDFENNSAGGVLIGRAHECNVNQNYFEGSPIGVSLGVSAGANFWSAQGCNVMNNFFTVTASAPIGISLQNTVDTNIAGNTQNYGGSETGANCLIDSLPYVAGVTGGELATVIGHNHVELAGIGHYLCSGGLVTSALGGVGSFSQVNSQIQMYDADQQFNINSSVTSEPLGLQFMTPTGVCTLIGDNDAARASFAAGTSYVDTPIYGGVTVHHPSGTAMIFDVICANRVTQ